MEFTGTEVSEGRIEDYCTVPKAAAMRGVAASAVYAKMRQGKVQAYRVHNQIVLLVKDVEALTFRQKNSS